MSVIKNFFEHQREVTARREAYYKRLEEEMPKPHVEVIDTSAFDKELAEFDFLLKRNWFLDIEDIYELLWEADEEMFQEIVNRADTYDRNVKNAIYDLLPSNLGRHTKLKIHNITDEETELQELKEQERQKKERQDAWEAYKAEQKLEPPVGYLDSELDEMFCELQELKKNLEDAKKKSLTGRYVPPSMRDKVVSADPTVLDITKKIQKAENEIIIQNQFIEQEKNEWFMRKRNEFEQAMLAV